MSLVCLGNYFTGFDCSFLWISMTLLFFISALFRKWVAEPSGMEYNIIGAVALSEICFIAMALIFHNIQWALGVGVIGVIIGGWLGAKLLGGGEGGDFE